MNNLDMLRNCLDAIFHDKVLEARKYLPSVIAALGNHNVSTALYPELVLRILKFGALANSEQYDMIVKIMNSALSDREVATVLLPLIVIIYRVSRRAIVSFCVCTCDIYIMWNLHTAGGEARSSAGIVHLCTKSPHLE